VKGKDQSITRNPKREVPQSAVTGIRSNPSFNVLPCWARHDPFFLTLKYHPLIPPSLYYWYHQRNGYVGMVDKRDLGSRGRYTVWVQIPLAVLGEILPLSVQVRKKATTIPDGVK
jgi:hypothetical protein